MRPASESSVERRLFIGVFVAALAAHACLTFYHFQMPFLAGHEFRQTQTALIAYYIDKSNNFAPLYEQPILGKPWIGLILEFPLYQWGVVWLSRLTGWEHFLAARAISAAAFYLSLPALGLLLGRWGLSGARRLLALSFLLLCPVYIFYTRAFLIDPLEFMCCAWFLAAFVRTMDTRDWRWWLLAAVAGVGAALIKSFMLAVWLLPAAGYGAWMLWRDVRARTGWQAPLRTVAWGIGSVVLPFAALKWWIGLTDPIKAAHPSAWIFTSQNLSVGNWGLFKFATLLSPEVWRTLMARWSEAIMPAWLLLTLTAVAFVAVPRARAKLGGVAGVFFLSQVLFPFAYAYQDYYYYSCAGFLVVGFALVWLALWDSALPRGAVLALALVPLGGQLWSYSQNYLPQQRVESQGWTTFTLSLKEMTPAGSVIVIAGQDWAAITPYYTERRALMVRNGLEFDQAYLERAFRDLADEDVSALVVSGKVRENRLFLQRAIAAFDLESVPTYTHLGQTDIYLRRIYVPGALVRICNSEKRYGREIAIPARPADGPRQPMAVPPAVAKTAFPMITPGPFKCDFQFGYLMGELLDQPALGAHADSYVWLRPPADARTIVWEFGIYDDAWQRNGEKTNGIEMLVTAERPNGSRRQIFRRVLTPTTAAEDRGLQRETISYTPETKDEVLRFASLGNGSIAFDWGYWRRIEVK